MKLPNNPKDKTPHAPGRGSDKQHPETPTTEIPTTQDHPGENISAVSKKIV
jgi:hypothetical protein